MEKPNEIKGHILAVEQTRKITNAMEMISSNRLHRVMGRIEQNDKYFNYIQKTMKHIVSLPMDVSHPYLIEREVNNVTFIVIAGDKGLCGAYNSSVLELALHAIKETPNYSLITVGNVAEDFFQSRGITPYITLFGIVQDPTLSRSRDFAQQIMRLFDKGQTDEVRVIYTSYYGETKNKPVQHRLLPIAAEDYVNIEDDEAPSLFEYYPSPQKVFDQLVPQYVIGILFGIMLQAYASEHFARVNAMRSATTNANDMLKELKTSYNLARQSAITNEIAELTGTAEILRKQQNI